MFSGGDSGEEGVNTYNKISSFPLVAQSISAMASNNIDWASLAQQWIQMKDFSDAMPEAPPPPNISNINVKEKSFEEQGEADMEVEKDDEYEQQQQQEQPLPIMVIPHQHQHMPVENSWIIPPNMQTPMQQPDLPFVATTVEPWNTWPSRVSLPPPMRHIPTSETVTFYRPPDVALKAPITLKNARDMPNSSSTSTIDANKRKILPAWIREGLEKMEREKQKQIKQEQVPVNNYIDEGGQSLASVKEQIDPAVKYKSALTESDSSGNEDDNYEHEDDDDNYADFKEHSTTLAKSAEETQLKTGKNYEQKLSELMIVVRRTLTELLLEVTNEEILNISQEAIRSQKSKASSAQVIRKSAISSLTGKLGLAAYADSSTEHSSSESDQDSDDGNQSAENRADSEEEIKANIRSLRREFAKTSEEIEEEIAEAELREEQKLKHYMQQEKTENKGKSVEKDVKTKSSDSHGSLYPTGKSFDKDFGETPDTKFHQSNGKRQKERMTRFSDNKDSRRASSYFSSHTATNTIDMQTTQSASSSYLHLVTQNPLSYTLGKTADSTPSSYSIGTQNPKTALEMMAAASNILANVTKAKKTSRRKHDSSHDSSSDSFSSDSKDSYSRMKSKKKPSRSSLSRHESSSYYRKSSRRRDSSDSNDYYRKRSKKSSSYSKRDRRSKSRTRSRSRSQSRSRSRSSYSSGRRKY